MRNHVVHDVWFSWFGFLRSMNSIDSGMPPRESAATLSVSVVARRRLDHSSRDRGGYVIRGQRGWKSTAKK